MTTLTSRCFSREAHGGRRRGSSTRSRRSAGNRRETQAFTMIMDADDWSTAARARPLRLSPPGTPPSPGPGRSTQRFGPPQAAVTAGEVPEQHGRSAAAGGTPAGRGQPTRSVSGAGESPGLAGLTHAAAAAAADRRSLCGPRLSRRRRLRQCRPTMAVTALARTRRGAPGLPGRQERQPDGTSTGGYPSGAIPSGGLRHPARPVPNRQPMATRQTDAYQQTGGLPGRPVRTGRRYGAYPAGGAKRQLNGQPRPGRCPRD